MLLAALGLLGEHDEESEPLALHLPRSGLDRRARRDRVPLRVGEQVLLELRPMRKRVRVRVKVRVRVRMEVGVKGEGGGEGGGGGG